MTSLRLNDSKTTLLTITFLGKSFDIHQDPSSLNHGLCVWDASLCYLRYLEHNPREQEALRGASVLELGAGTGILGIALAHCLGSHVVLTDLPSVTPNLAANLAANPLPPGCAGSCVVLPYSWDGRVAAEVVAASPSGAGFSHIIGTDVGYSETLNPTLLASAAAYAAGRRATTLLVNELRCEVAQAVFDRVAPQLFKVHRVPSKKLHPDFQQCNFVMVRLTLLKGSKAEALSGGGGEGGEEAEE